MSYSVLFICVYIFVALPRNGYASSWSLSMEHCRKSHPSTYLLGDFNLDYPKLVCEHISQNLQLFWVGVARQIYTTIDQGMYQILSFIIIYCIPENIHPRFIFALFALVVKARIQDWSSYMLHLI